MYSNILFCSQGHRSPLDVFELFMVYKPLLACFFSNIKALFWLAFYYYHFKNTTKSYNVTLSKQETFLEAPYLSSYTNKWRNIWFIFIIMYTTILCNKNDEKAIILTLLTISVQVYLNFAYFTAFISNNSTRKKS